ncbi:MAG: choice-of-anchor B family protein [marine benthic group bacterium]|nr:choice-of-anchor B family protein [Gemmatimonadota bacterium]
MKAHSNRWRLPFAAVIMYMASTAVASDAQAQGFGASAAVAGDVMFVSEPQNQSTPGYVHLFQRAGDVWTEAGRLEAPDAEPGDGFGGAVDAHGGTMVTAAYSALDGAGEAYVFSRQADGSWALEQRLTPADATEGDAFGVALALDGDNLLIGAFARGDTAGAVYAFRRDGSGQFRQEAVLQADDTVAGDRFGVSIALDGDRALVAATRHDEQRGGVYLFERRGGTWIQVAKLQSDDVEKGNRFGSSLALSDDRAFAGTDRFAGLTGAVFGFARDADSDSWNETVRLQAFDATRGMRFGSAVAFEGEELWVGSGGANGFEGRAYRFVPDASGDGWRAAEKIAADEPRGGDFFAGNVVLADELAVVSAVNADFGLGAAHLFVPTADGGWSHSTRLFVEESSLDPVLGGQVDCSGGQAGQFDCNDMDLVAFIPTKDLGAGRGIMLNDIWGWTDPATGREFALVGRMDGTSFVDVTDATSPIFLGDLPLTEGANPAAWRDIKVYENHAYIVADGAGPHGMQVFDLTRLLDVDGGPVTFAPTAFYDRIASAHNIVINEETGFAYAVGASMGGETCGGALHMIDIRDPRNPTFAGCFAETETGRQKTGYTHDAQCVIYRGPDSDHQGREICFNASETALGIADVTDKKAPRSISVASYPNVGYTHQGWLTEDHQYFYINDELDEINGSVEGTRTLVWDVTDLDDPILVREHFGTNAASDHNLYVRGDRMYQSNYVSGLRVLDISDPENPVEVGYFDTVPFGENVPGFDGSWSNYPYFESGVIVVTSMREGLFVLKRREGRPVS